MILLFQFPKSWKYVSLPSSLAEQGLSGSLPLPAREEKKKKTKQHRAGRFTIVSTDWLSEYIQWIRDRAFKSRGQRDVITSPGSEGKCVWVLFVISVLFLSVQSKRRFRVFPRKLVLSIQSPKK